MKGFKVFREVIAVVLVLAVVFVAGYYTAKNTNGSKEDVAEKSAGLELP